MKTFWLLLASQLLLGVNPVMAKPEWKDEGYLTKRQDGKCDLALDFGSYGGGIDQVAYDATKTYLSMGDGIKKVTEWGWGKEGERSLCLEISRKQELKTVYEGLSAFIAKKRKDSVTAKLGSVEIRAEGYPTKK